METADDRIIKLKKLGAGDAQCSDCLSVGVPLMATCNRCIADSPAFTEAIEKLMATTTA